VDGFEVVDEGTVEVEKDGFRKGAGHTTLNQEAVRRDSKFGFAR
jgi:hypothetical protein